MFGLKQGEDVRVSLVSSDASGGAAVIIADANGVDRPLQPYERLVLDSLLATVAAAITIAVTDPGAAVSSDAITLASFSATAPEWHSDGEGLNVSVGAVPVVTASGPGAVVVTGTGRIINGKTQGVRPSWREKLTP